jgi:hypothetical protein
MFGKSYVRGWIVCLVLSAVAAGPFMLTAPAQDKSASKPPVEAKVIGVPAGVMDKEFEPFFNPVAVAIAWDRNDLAELVGAGERLVTAEQKIGRPHKGLKTEAYFLAVAKVALTARDAAAIERLEKAAAGADRKDLAEQLATIRSVMATSRAAGPAVMANVNELTPESLAFYRHALEGIELAKNAGNPKEIELLLSQASEVKGWSEPMRKQIQDAASKAKASIQGSSDEAADLLSKLGSASRAAGTVYIDTNGRSTTVSAGQQRSLPQGAQIVNADTTSIASSGGVPGTVAITIPPPTPLRKTPNSFIALCPGEPAALVVNVGGRNYSIWMDNPALFMFTTTIKSVSKAQLNSYTFLGNCRRGQKIVTAPGRPWYLITTDFNNRDMSAIPFDDSRFVSANGSRAPSSYVSTSYIDGLQHPLSGIWAKQ